MEQEPVEMQHEGNAQRLVGLEGQERVDGVSIAGELLLVPRTEAGRSLRNPLGSLSVEHHALDRVGRGDRGGPRMLGKLLEHLRHLILERTLLAPPGVYNGKYRTKLGGLACEGAIEVDEALHRANNRIVVLIAV